MPVIAAPVPAEDASQAGQVAPTTTEIAPATTEIAPFYVAPRGVVVAPPPAPAGEPAGQPAPASDDAQGEAPWANWTPAGENPPGPPSGGTPGAGDEKPRRRPHRAKYVLLASALAAVLATGIAVERVRTATATPNVTIGAQSAPAISPSSSSSATDLQTTVEQVVKAVQPSVVEVTSTSGRSEAIGSGDILTSDGYIVTNDHVVAGYSTYTVTLSNGKTLPAQLVGQDPQDDLAVLKVSATGLQPIAFADSSKAQVGEFTIAVGNPLGLQQSATLGIVSALNRTASEAPSGPAGTLTGLIQTSAPINPGNSGGALVDLHGELIGIPTLGAVDSSTGSTANGIGFAIPANRVKYVAQQLIQNGKLTSTGQGFLGIQGQDVTAQLAAADGLSTQSGVLVTGFANAASGSSPAQQGGLQTGDVIVAVNGQNISSSNDLAAAIQNDQAGTRVTVTVVRGSQQRTITVTLGERPVSAQG